jgi:hypothetical protein
MLHKVLDLVFRKSKELLKECRFFWKYEYPCSTATDVFCHGL